jgi:hypothetical protein
MTVIIIKIHPGIIQPVLKAVPVAWCAAAVGAATPGTFVVPIATAAGPPIAAASMASACARIIDNPFSFYPFTLFSAASRGDRSVTPRGEAPKKSSPKRSRRAFSIFFPLNPVTLPSFKKNVYIAKKGVYIGKKQRKNGHKMSPLKPFNDGGFGRKIFLSPFFCNYFPLIF